MGNRTNHCDRSLKFTEKFLRQIRFFIVKFMNHKKVTRKIDLKNQFFLRKKE